MRIRRQTFDPYAAAHQALMPGRENQCFIEAQPNAHWWERPWKRCSVLSKLAALAPARYDLTG
jgi:hypothetical protein